MVAAQLENISAHANAGLDLVGSGWKLLSRNARRKRTKRTNIIGLAVVAILLLLVTVQSHRSFDNFSLPLKYEISNSTSALQQHQHQHQQQGVVSDELKKFYRNITQLVKQNSPTGELDAKKQKWCDLGNIGLTETTKFDKLTKLELSKCINVPADTVSDLKDLHLKFQKLIKDEILPAASRLSKPAYEGEGIVILGGGQKTLLALPAINAIRTSGGVTIRNTTPVELVIPPRYKNETAFCQHLLPQLDPTGLTRCVLLGDLYDGEDLEHLEDQQLKPLALLVSSFQKALLLDCDSYVVNSLDGYFDGEIFRDKGLVLWPDAWRRLHHPALYDVLNIKVDENNQPRNSIDIVTPREVFQVENKLSVPYHDLEHTIPDGSTDTGQLLIDKDKHLDTLIMSVYYNFNGPSYYYPLLEQGCNVNGDKNTYTAAAHAMHPKDGSYYHVRTPIGMQGHWVDEDGARLADPNQKSQTRRVVAGLQHDYNEDYKYYKWSREVIGNNFREKLAQFRKKWYQAHKSDFSEDEKKRQKELENNKELNAKFWSQFTGSYKLEDYLSFFDFTPVTFVHSRQPSYDPWQLSQIGDLKFDGARITDQHADDEEYKPSASGHYRMYGPEFTDQTNFDLELSSWLLFQRLFCSSDREAYTQLAYLQEQISNTPDPDKSVQEMCKYVGSRVQYLRDTTWDGSVH